MAARLVRPLYARLDARTGKAEMARARPSSNGGGSATKSSDAGAIKVMRDDKTTIEERRELYLAPLSSSDNKPINVVRDGKAGTDEYADPPPPHRTATADDVPIKVGHDRQAGTDEYARAPLPPHTEPSDDSSVTLLLDDEVVAEERSEPSLSSSPVSADETAAEVPRRDKIVIEELEREHQFRAALGLMAKAHKGTRADEALDTRTIIRIAAAVIVLGLGFTALLPSILTRDPAAPTVTLTTSAPPAVAAPAQTEQEAVAQPVPAPPPAQVPEAAPAVPPPNDLASIAKTTPALRGSSAPAELGEARAAKQAVAPDAGKATGGLALTAAEKAAVTRGLQELEKQGAVPELEKQAAVSAPRRPGLTAEEQAAIERGLRELEKAEQAKQ